MSLIYRPHCGGLAESMERKQEFDTVCDLLDWLVEEHMGAFRKEQIHLTYYGYDSRIDWETFIVTTDCYHDLIYDSPAAIGFCTFIKK